MPPDPVTSLADDQARMMDVIQKGPSAYPEGMFAGPSHRALLGLKAHANTISHARLVALEDTYPRTLNRMGLEWFNTLSRAFIDLPETKTRKLVQIGADFAAFLTAQGVDDAAVQLAHVEWAWLQSYHAADSPALALADLASLDEVGLLELPVAVHPACRWLNISANLADDLPDMVPCDAPITTVLITRPDATVQLHALNANCAAILEIVVDAKRMRNLLAGAIEILDGARALPGILALIGAGVLAARDT